MKKTVAVPAPSSTPPTDQRCMIWKTTIPIEHRIQVISLEGRVVGFVDKRALETEVIWPLRSAITKFPGVSSTEEVTTFDLVAFAKKAPIEAIERICDKLGPMMADAIADIRVATKPERDKKRRQTRDIGAMRQTLRRTGVAVRAEAGQTTN